MDVESGADETNEKEKVTKKKNHLIFWATAAIVLIADRITKELAGGIPAAGITLIPGVIGLQYAENEGAAFSMLSRGCWAY